LAGRLNQGLKVLKLVFICYCLSNWSNIPWQNISRAGGLGLDVSPRVMYWNEGYAWVGAHVLLCESCPNLNTLSLAAADGPGPLNVSQKRIWPWLEGSVPPVGPQKDPRESGWTSGTDTGAPPPSTTPRLNTSTSGSDSP
jgi:hypothetical protein